MEIKAEILTLLKPNEEEFKHAQDTLKWLLVLNPNPDEIQQICALGHDIERGINPWKNKDFNFTEEERKKFRDEHSKRSADIIKKMLEQRNFKPEEINRAENIILKHEFGGNAEENLMRDADSLANFQWCDDFYRKEKTENLKAVFKRMYERMSPENRKFIKTINFKNKEIENIQKEIT